MKWSPKFRQRYAKARVLIATFASAIDSGCRETIDVLSDIIYVLTLVPRAPKFWWWFGWGTAFPTGYVAGLDYLWPFMPQNKHWMLPTIAALTFVVGGIAREIVLDRVREEEEKKKKAGEAN